MFDPGAEGLAGAAAAAGLRAYDLVLQLSESTFQVSGLSILLLGSHDHDLRKVGGLNDSPDLKLLWFE
jgi:hypothetical protein